MFNKSVMATAMVAASLLVGCSGTSKFEINADKLSSKGSTPADKAELIALAGEKIVLSPVTFMQADELFSIALEKDPKNARALFYKAILKPAMTARGIAKRVEGIVDRGPITVKKSFEKERSKVINSDLKEFLLDGQANIVNEKDVQGFVGEIVQALKDARKTMTDLSGNELTLHLTKNLCDESEDGCGINRIDRGIYQVRGYNVTEETQVKLGFADFEALKLGIGAYQVYLGIVTAYDLTGSEALANKLLGVQAVVSSQQEGDSTITPQELFAAIRNEKSLGKLVNPVALKDILSLGTEAVEAVKLANSMSKELCPRGFATPANRPGYAFSEGMCPQNADQTGIALVESYLRGPVETILDIKELRYQSYPYTYWDGKRNVTTYYGYIGEVTVGKYPTRVNWAGVLSQPIGDLKSLLPTQFDNCGMPTNVGDDFVGGLLPKGDAVEVLRVMNRNPKLLKSTCSSVSSR